LAQQKFELVGEQPGDEVGRSPAGKATTMRTRCVGKSCAGAEEISHGTKTKEAASAPVSRRRQGVARLTMLLLQAAAGMVA
jgi:hypothetical protein